MDKILAISGVNWDKAFVNMPEEDLLKEILTTFVRAAERELTELGENFEAGVIGNDPESLELYKIKVHAMKHSTALFGADALSEEAKRLEYAAKDGRKDYIKENHSPFVQEYRRVADEIGEALGDEFDSKGGAIDDEALLQKIALLETAMEEFDTITMNDISFELEGKEFSSEEIKEKMGALQEAVVNFDIDAFKAAAAGIRSALSL